MPKTIIYQYWFGSKPLPGTMAGKRNMEQYAKRIGADYLFATDPSFFGGPCSLMKKYHALRPVYDDMFLEYDQVLYADLDVFAVDGCNENIFEEDVKHVGICTEPLQPELRSIKRQTGICLKNDNAWAAAVKHIYNEDVNRDNQNRPLIYNSGVVLFTKEGLIESRQKFTQFEKHITQLKSNRLSGFYLSDQTYYQTMLHVSGVDFKVLDNKWNSQIHFTDPTPGELQLVDTRTKNTNFVHVQIRGADHWDADAHFRMVNLPPEDWNIPGGIPARYGNV